ncbi:hypothetical protein C1646_671933 [Rhizophagus diaphanus]|nr:hypothetical protein C1646_671933 [Rhizophagus diaphanus] [Rhizophagus sp. MUCL 43196]
MFYAVTFNETYHAFLLFLSILRTPGRLLGVGVIVFVFFLILRIPGIFFDLDDSWHLFSILRTPGMLGVVAFCYFSLMDAFIFDLEDSWCFFSILRTSGMLGVVAFVIFRWFSLMDVN